VFDDSTTRARLVTAVDFGKLRSKIDNANSETPASSVLVNCLVMNGFSLCSLKIIAARLGSGALADSSISFNGETLRTVKPGPRGISGIPKMPRSQVHLF
jgi:hypothetical protein